MSERMIAENELLQQVRRLCTLNAQLLAACKDGLDIITWMSGSPSFSPQGEACQGWTKAQSRIRDIRAAIAKAGEEGHPVEQETPCSVQAKGTAPCRLPNWFREPTEWADGTTRSIAERLAAITKTREEA